MAEGAQAGSILANRLVDPALLFEFQHQYTTQQTALKVLDSSPLVGYMTDVYVQVNAVVDVTLHLADATVIKWKFYGSAAGNGVVGRLQSPISIPVGQILYLTSSGAGTFFIAFSGYYKRVAGP